MSMIQVNGGFFNQLTSVSLSLSLSLSHTHTHVCAECKDFKTLEEGRDT